MMYENGVEQLLVTKEGLMIINFNPTDKTMDIVGKVDNIFECLNYVVKSDTDILFEDVLDIIFKYKTEINQFFSSYLNGVDINELYQDYTTDYHGDLSYCAENLSKIDELNLSFFNHYHENIEIPDPIDLSETFVGSFLIDMIAMVGVTNLPDNIDELTINEMEEIGLELNYVDVGHIPLSELKRLPFYINNSFDIHGISYNPDNKMEVDRFSVLHTYKHFTLFELITGIFESITMFGSPHERLENYNLEMEETEKIIRRKKSIDDLLDSINDDDDSE